MRVYWGRSREWIARKLLKRKDKENAGEPLDRFEIYRAVGDKAGNRSDQNARGCRATLSVRPVEFVESTHNPPAVEQYLDGHIFPVSGIAYREFRVVNRQSSGVNQL